MTPEILWEIPVWYYAHYPSRCTWAQLSRFEHFYFKGDGVLCEEIDRVMFLKLLGEGFADSTGVLLKK